MLFLAKFDRFYRPATLWVDIAFNIIILFVFVFVIYLIKFLGIFNKCFSDNSVNRYRFTFSIFA